MEQRIMIVFIYLEVLVLNKYLPFSFPMFTNTLTKTYRPNNKKVLVVVSRQNEQILTNKNFRSSIQSLIIEHDDNSQHPKKKLHKHRGHIFDINIDIMTEL